MTTSWNAASSRTRLVLKHTLPPAEHEAHLRFIRCTWMRAGWTPIFVAQCRTRSLKSA